MSKDIGVIISQKQDECASKFNRFLEEAGEVIGELENIMARVIADYQLSLHRGKDLKSF